MAQRPVIVLEFNELTPSLIDKYLGEGSLPQFERLRNESSVFTTVADERPPALEPWIQWVTVHTGLTYQEHQVFHLNEGHKLKAKRVWELVAEAGQPVWVCGSMNVPSAGNGQTAVLPDPWCTKVKPTPAELAPYFEFVQRNVLEHTNEQIPLTVSDYFRFTAFMGRRGISLSTISAIGKQLLDERSSDVRWKRVVLLDLLQFDVFASYYRRLRPLFSTFFLNSTAHYQHAYWDSMEPESFPASAATDKAQYRYAIKYGYQQMDRLLARFIKLADANQATLVLCTALSQQPSPDFHDHGGEAFYRPRDFMAFARTIGITTAFTAEPVMSEQFHLQFQSRQAAAEAADRLTAVRLDGCPMMYVRQDESRLFVGCGIHREVSKDAVFTMNGQSIPFFTVFYRLETGKTGVHHPDGMLWIRLPERRHEVFQERVSLTSVAPTLLKLCGLPPGSQMREASLPLA